MRNILALTLILAAPAAAQTTTNCTTTGNQTRCKSEPMVRGPIDYSAGQTKLDTTPLMQGLAIRQQRKQAKREAQADYAPPVARTQTTGASSIPTARDLYVGCYLMLHGSEASPGEAGGIPAYSGLNCAMISKIAQGKDTQAKKHYCLPSPEPDFNQMGQAYIEFYEKAGGFLANANGPPTFLEIIAMKWPCKP